MDILLRNNTGNQGKNVLIDGFVVRLKIFNNILNELQLSLSDKPEQNYLIIGQRGTGKTTLLYRLKYAIEDDTQLSQFIIPVMLSEEQYHLTELMNLWETIAEQINEYPGFEGIRSDISLQLNGTKYDEEKAYEVLDKKLKEKQKKIVLFIENIDVLLKKIGREGQQRLREVLTTSHNIRVIGSSTTYFEGIINYSDPFYDFFKVIQLNGLSKQETFKLLLKIATQSKETAKIELLLRHSSTRVEALRRLTAGNPRMMSYLYQIFLDNGNGRAIQDLYRLLDDLTFLYKAELDQLSPQQQKVIDIIARHWDAISVKELALSTRMESKHISSILNALEKNQVVERITTKTKNNLYRLKDRFLNIWYLMRFGKKKDQENILWLVRFYDTWCNKSELSERVLKYIDNLLEGGYDNVAAIDMVNTFLSCKNVSAMDKYKLFKTTKLALPKAVIRDLKLSQDDWFGTIKDLVKRKRYDQAADVLEEMGDKGLIYYTFSYWIYLNKGDFKKAAESLEWLFNEKQDSTTAFTLADILERKLTEIDKAIEYYEFSLEKGNYEAAFRLGQIQYLLKREEKKAIKYYQIAIENNIEEAIMGLATINFSNGNYEEAKRLCRLAIDKGDSAGYLNLSVLLQKEGEIEEAIDTLEKAIELGVDDALIALGDLYLNDTKGNELKAKSLFEKGIEVGVTDAYYALGKYLLRSDKSEKEGIKVLKQGIKRGDYDSAHLLAHHYQESKLFKKAEVYFVKSFDMGHRTSLLCLSNCAFYDKLSDRKEYILDLFEKKMFPIHEPLISIEYCKLLVWNERFHDSLKKLREYEDNISKALSGDSEEYKEDLLSGLTGYFIRLMATKQYNLLKDLFNSSVVNYKQILKPVYFALMRYLKHEFPNEYLKAGSEMEETIEEIINKTEKVRLLMT